MIPTIEQIVEDLAAGAITKKQATAWIQQHVASKLNEDRRMFAAFALQGLLAHGKAALVSTPASVAVVMADELVEALSK